jgi:glycerophosphoryl diester phosphodiesterase
MKHLAAAAALLLAGLAPAAAAATATAAGSSSAAAAPKPWNVTDHVALKDFIIQAHRGAGDLAEEGTLESFQLGWSLGAIPEADVRATQDGVIVSFHDNNFKRIIKDADEALKKSSVEKSTWAFLQTLDVGLYKGPQFAGRRVARMSGIFDYMRTRPELRIYLDIKKVDFARLAALVKAAGVEERVIVASSKPEFLIEWKQHAPASGTLLWCSKADDEITRMLDDLVATGNIRHITSVQLHVHPNRNAKNYNAAEDGGRDWKKIPCTTDPGEPFSRPRDFIQSLGARLRSLGLLYQAFAYSKDATFYAPLMDLGVASFATDRPDIAAAEVKKYYAARGKK